jgi:hypothetical protein
VCHSVLVILVREADDSWGYEQFDVEGMAPLHLSPGKNPWELALMRLRETNAI